ncbi:MAG TPA: hypothetical protein VGI75_11905, partial [Pirellulales bacterium]
MKSRQVLLRRITFGLVLITFADLSLLSSASAAIVGETGAIVFVANPPADTSRGAWESNTQIRA